MARREAVALATARLRLRPCTDADVDALHALWTDPVVRRWLWDDVVIDRAIAAERVAASAAAFATAGWGLWAIEPRSGGPLLGIAGLAELEPAIGPELVFALHPGHHGQGYATEASRAVLDHAFGTLGFTRVPGRTDLPNVDSMRVLERLGMRREEERPGAGPAIACFAIERRDWRAGRESGPFRQ